MKSFTYAVKCALLRRGKTSRWSEIYQPDEGSLLATLLKRLLVFLLVDLSACVSSLEDGFRRIFDGGSGESGTYALQTGCPETR